MQNSERPHGLVTVAAQKSISSYFQRAAPLSKLELQNRGYHLNDGTPKPLKCVIATPDAPNPKDPNQMDPRSERETLGLDFGGKGRTRPAKATRAA